MRILGAWGFGLLVMLDVALVAASASAPMPRSKTWHVKVSEHPTITIVDNVVHRNDPKKLFGFNINFRQFQKQLWNKGQVKPGVLDALEPFEGAIFRYPGGVVANSFHWHESIGELKSREPQSSYYQRKLKQVEFGIDEYVEFVSDLNGMPWYVLNLVGLDLSSPTALAEADAVAESNLALSDYLAKSFSDSKQPLHLQLGNELDRGSHQMSANEYASRSKAVVDLINKESRLLKPEFVSFLRDFRWRYKGAKKGLPESQPRDFMRDVLQGLGDSVSSYSLNHYYDGNRVDGRSRSIPFWLRHLSRSIDDYRSITKEAAEIWITEHGRQPMSRSSGKDNSKQSTSNMAAAISTADYLIAVAQFPEIKGAVWHALNAGPWQLFDYSVKHNDLRARPIYWGLRVLRMMDLPVCLETYTESPNLSNYAGGYDIRALAFRDEDKKELGLRAINRAAEAQKVKINYARFSGQKVKLNHYVVNMPRGKNLELDDDDVHVDLSPAGVEFTFDKDGSLYVELPPYSVSTLQFRAL